MAQFPTIKEMAENVANEAFDSVEIDGKTIRQWAELITNGDVVEVVRCKNCKYNTGEHKCFHPDSVFSVPADDDYCSYGRRKE